MEQGFDVYPPHVSGLASYTTETLPLQQFKKNETRKYKDAVCDLLQLSFESIRGNGNCFFESVSALLQHQRALNLGSADIRQQVVHFLHECQNGEHSILGERCVVDMEGELGQPLSGLVGARRNIGPIPQTVQAYLELSAINGVWVQGYHWLRAVAAIFNCCVVVVVHAHQSVYVFGDPAHERFHLYKCDVETHYDALPRRNTSFPPVLDQDDDNALLALASAASSSSSSDDPSNQRQPPVKRSARLLIQAPSIIFSSVDPVRKLPCVVSDNSTPKSNPLKTSKSRAVSVFLRDNPIPEPAPVVQLPASAPKPIPNSARAKEVVQLDDTLLVIPPQVTANGWPEAKSHFIGLMKRTGHSKAFCRTSKLPPSHPSYWAKIICPVCPFFIICAADSDGLEWDINSQSHGVCTSIVSSKGASAANLVSVFGLGVTAVESWYCHLCRCQNDSMIFAFCSNPQSHKFCSECFDGYVQFKVKGSERARFIESQCIVCCPTPGCSHCVDMRVCAQHMSVQGYSLYLSCFSEYQIIAVQKACEDRLKAAELAKHAIAPIANDFSKYVEHIANELILPRCPNPDCRIQIPDFEACSALQCGRILNREGVEEVIGGCGANFCGWCCTTGCAIFRTKSECHAHVRTCPFNPAEG